jgi:hypothetical protein
LFVKYAIGWGKARSVEVVPYPGGDNKSPVSLPKGNGSDWASTPCIEETTKHPIIAIVMNAFGNIVFHNMVTNS